MPAADDAERLADMELVQRILRGDRGAVARLAERLECVPKFLKLRNARVRSPFDEHELADIAQDVLVIAWRKLPDFQGRSVLPAWVYLICVFEFQNALRRKLRGPRPVGAAVGAGTASPASPEPILVRETDPWEYEDVHVGLRRIGTEEANVIRLKHFGGRTFDEIGRSLGVSTSTAKDRYYRGIAELRPLLAERGPGES